MIDIVTVAIALSAILSMVIIAFQLYENVRLRRINYLKEAYTWHFNIAEERTEILLKIKEISDTFAEDPNLDNLPDDLDAAIFKVAQGYNMMGLFAKHKLFPLKLFLEDEADAIIELYELLGKTHPSVGRPVLAQSRYFTYLNSEALKYIIKENKHKFQASEP